MLPSETSDDLPAAVRRGVPWVVVGQVASQLVSIATLAALYRLIAPEDFGLLGMALPFAMLPRMLATLGLSAATVQRESLSREERSALFWMQQGVGLLFTLACVALAPLAALWYGVAEVAPLVMLLAPGVLLASMSATHQALLERNLDLARVTSVRLLGQLLGAMLAIAAAFQGWKSGALIVQQLGELLALAISTWIVHPWWPGWPRRVASARALLHFSSYYSASSLLFFAAQNIDKVLLGWWLGGTPAGQALVGAYTQAYNLMMRPVYLVTTPISGVLLPALSRAAGDRALFFSLTSNAFRLAALALLPCSVGLVVVGEEAMLTLGGETWSDAALLLTILAPTIFAQGWINLCGSVLAARGRADLLCFLAFVLTLILTQAITAGYFFGTQWGPPQLGPAWGVAWGLTLAIAVVLFVPYVWIAFRAAQIPPSAIFALLRRPLWSAVIMGMIVVLVRSQLPDIWPVALRLLLLFSTGAISYTALAGPEIRRVLVK